MCIPPAWGRLFSGRCAPVGNVACRAYSGGAFSWACRWLVSAAYATVAHALAFGRPTHHVPVSVWFTDAWGLSPPCCCGGAGGLARGVLCACWLRGVARSWLAGGTGLCPRQAGLRARQGWLTVPSVTVRHPETKTSPLWRGHGCLKSMPVSCGLISRSWRGKGMLVAPPQLFPVVPGRPGCPQLSRLLRRAPAATPCLWLQVMGRRTTVFTTVVQQHA